MTIRLYDYVLSADCYKVRLLLDFLGVSYERQAINFYPARQHLSPDFLGINPLGTLPALEDGAVRLWHVESILCYLARAYDQSASWLPEAAAELAAVMDWVAFGGKQLASASQARLHDLLGFEADIDRKRHEAQLALRALDDVLKLRQVQGEQWLVGSRPTLADLACFPDAALAGDAGLTHDEYPALRKWMRCFRALPGFHAMSGIPEFL